MNFFTGLTANQIWSFALVFILFNGYATFEAAALALFYVVSKPRRRGGASPLVRTAAVWYVVAAVWFMLAIISTVWAAPAEKSFVNDADQMFIMSDPRFQKIIIGVLFAGVGVFAMMIGLVGGARQKRAAREDALAA